MLFFANSVLLEYGTNITALQVDNRLKSVTGRAKKAKQNKRKSGAERLECPFEEEMGRIIKKDDSIIPEVVLGPGYDQR